MPSSKFHCERCEKELSLSASLSNAISTFDNALSSSGSGSSPTGSARFDTSSALVATGITGLLGVSTYHLVPIPQGNSCTDQPSLSPRQREKSKAFPPERLRDGESARATGDTSGMEQNQRTHESDSKPRANSLTANLAVRFKLLDLLNSHNPPEPTPAVDPPDPWRKGSQSSGREHEAETVNGKSDDDVLRRAGNRKIHHPLCRECTDQLLELMAAETTLLRKERDAFQHFDLVMSQYEQHQSEVGVEDLEELKKEIKSLRDQEEEARRALYASEKERAEVEKELEQIAEEEKALEAEENDFWVRYNEANLQLNELQGEASSLEQTIALDTALLDRLRRTNVYNDAFSIGHDAGFATINGLRLGRSSSVNVDWAEINAAWGQVVLLLDTLARKCGLQFKGYKLHPKGSFSSIERLSTNSTASGSGSAAGNIRGDIYELYYSNAWSVDTLFSGRGRSFDRGMEAFMECLRQMMEFASARDDPPRFPHTINKDKIGEVSIKRSGSEESWTRALRHVLLTLKLLMSWVVNDSEDSEETNRSD
ncbi:APG6-domain-containing protein [Tilletiaria anomala UBC 951]|uniref:APG6-domain-containing protein n=1 Tax=Tilletiaria anomala (strain ATCC 24038 / CBS 436.72 / UBC 951) TaxID=1037660 RepID=A0A066WIE1_TILAU|nr:APG6-domain-containing protein [Tilletiaria anomala UBC 951]KDN53611.1 APG6-domain-containing protein [Tilletiaria anomala UBC 951]